MVDLVHQQSRSQKTRTDHKSLRLWPSCFEHILQSSVLFGCVLGVCDEIDTHPLLESTSTSTVKMHFFHFFFFDFTYSLSKFMPSLGFDLANLVPNFVPSYCCSVTNAKPFLLQPQVFLQLVPALLCAVQNIASILLDENFFLSQRASISLLISTQA